MIASGCQPKPFPRPKLLAVLISSLAMMILGCGGDANNAATGKSDSVTDGSTLGTVQSPSKPVNLRTPIVRIDTNHGAITLKLDGVNAPGTVSNFLNYATEGYYDSTLIHFVSPGKMLVAGGYTTDRQSKPVRTPIRNEAHNGLKNVRGTIAMTRNPQLIDSATSQFFINLEDAPQRDHQGDSADQYGYCVFGQITNGLDVADKISQSVTADLGGDLQQSPEPPVVINSIRVVP